MSLTVEDSTDAGPTGKRKPWETDCVELFFDTDPVDFQRGKTGSIDQETALKREKLYMASRVLPSSQSFADISDFDMIHSGQPMTQGGFTDTGLSCDTDGMPLEYLMDLIFRKQRLH